MIVTKLEDKKRPYTGEQLRPHFLLTELGLKGSAMGAFVGPCLVKTEHLVDWEDRLAQDRIEAREMVHFIGEFFGMSLKEGVLLQRLFMAIAGDVLRERLNGEIVNRSGDDLFVRDRKLSVSIVTASPVSLLLHTGINVDPAGAPVPAVGLAELGIDPRTWTLEVLKRFVAEHEGMDWACAKVRPVI